MFDRVIVTCAIVGGVTTRQQSPHVPITPEEIAASAVAAADAGAAIVHIHVRDDLGNPTCDLTRFKKVVELIRARSNVLINLTSSTTIDSTDHTRMKPFIELKPEIATFDCGSMNQTLFAFENSPSFLKKSALAMAVAGVKPEVECFDTAMIHNAVKLVESKLLQKPLMLSCVLGVAGGARATVKNLQSMVDQIPPGTVWSGFAIGGRASIPIMYAALSMGGQLRVGMEDNIYLSAGVLAESNAQLVQQAVRVIENFGKQAATPDEARAILDLSRPKEVLPSKGV